MLARTLLFCSALLLVCLGPAQLAHADPLPLEQSLPVDGQSLQVRVAVEGEGIRLTVRAGGASAQADIPLPEAAEASAEVVRVAASREVLVIRARGRGEAAAVVAWVRGRPSVVWSARTDARGDPGERRREVLSLTDRTGDGLADVVVGVRREGVEVCGQQETLLMPRALDPASGQLRPVILRRFDATAAVPVTARRAADRAPPLVRALRPTGASSRAGATEESFALGAPHALTDADPTTFWAEGRGGAGAGELVTLRWDARLPIRAFAIRAATGAGASLGRPRTFYLVGDEGPPLAVTMPEDAGLHPGDRYWIEAPAPLRWRCVSLVLDQAYAPPRTAEAAVHTGLGEIEAYTEIDLGEGIVALVGLLVEGGSTGDEAARLLGALGAEAAGAILDAWERLDETGRRRAVRALAEQARRGVQQAYSGLERATRTDEPEQARVPALEALGTLIEPAATAILATRVTTDDAAILPLLRHSGATAALLAALAIEGGSERPTLRLAIAAAATRAEAADEVRAWAAQAPIAARASVALGLASRATSHALAAEVLRLCLADAARFEDRFRLAL
ncbi:MAG: hypothetical protein IT378_27065, partial [Sandaracinaceae bacterium]|nr:hypothetical protein [Sandaracinaceae bacterium]